eukprot:XP_011445865.1 PREDICTED: uncharacterized protein LOC105341195 [Crassostrea gigas]
MDKSFFIFLPLVLLQYQMCECRNRYCKDAVDSVEVVTACPTSNTEWEIAARKKNCERIASRQKCDSVERFKYHCVINGLRNKLVEVCAPSRIIFGHCVEFNVRGGVIQDQMSTPCNDKSPKCGSIYNSSDAYKYPDCYKLVTNGEVSSTTPKFTTLATFTKITSNKPGSVVTWIITAAVLILIITCIIFVAFRNKKLFPCCSPTSQPTTSSDKTGSTVRLLHNKRCQMIQEK